MFTIILKIVEVILYPFVVLFSPVYYLVARTGIGIRFTRKIGFHPIRIHYYQPVPRYETVRDEYFRTRQDFPGFSIDREKVLRTLRSLAPFADECRWPEYRGAKGSYYARNPNFGYSSAALLHAMIRAFGSRKVIEIGSGFSSLISIEALKKNHGKESRFTCIEPHPSGWLDEVLQQQSETAQLINDRSENVPLTTYVDLGKNDIVFIDSSHVSKLNSDVNYLYLHVLPRLPKETVVHIHDIYIPYEYPKVHFYGKQKIFWNEQYFLQAFLTNNTDFEIIMPGYYVQTDMNQDFRLTFPHYDQLKHRATSSFWLRKTK